MHKWMLVYIEQMDAALFSSDPSEEELDALEKIMPRWTERIQFHRDIIAELAQEKEEDDNSGTT